MTFEQIKENLKTIKLLEKDLMRDLTKEEKEIVINKGWEELLFNYLGFTDEDFSELKALRNLISTFYTQDEETFEKVVKEVPESVYFTLRHLADEVEKATNQLCSNPECEVENKKDSVKAYTEFMENLYDVLPKTEKSWFNKLTEKIHNKLFDVYKENRNEHQDCSDNILGGIMTDAVKDNVIEDMVEKLKAGETVEMTNDEYIETADYLAEHENKFFLNNNNGKVTLKVF